MLDALERHLLRVQRDHGRESERGRKKCAAHD
jgi:hypothetical protein